MISKADNVIRWVYARPEKRAEERGIPERTLVEHEKMLERIGLILRVPYCKINRRSNLRFYTVFLLDLPEGFAGATEQAEADAATAWARNESSRADKRLATHEILDGIVDDSVEGLEYDDE